MPCPPGELHARYAEPFLHSCNSSTSGTTRASLPCAARPPLARSAPAAAGLIHADPDQHLIVSDHRLVGPGELQDIRRAVPAVDDRLDRVLLLVRGGWAGLDQLLQHQQVRSSFPGDERAQPLAHQRRHHRRPQDLAVEAAKPPPAPLATHDHQRPPRGEGPPQLRQRTAAGGVDDEVPAAPPVGEVLAGVVDHLLRAEGADQVHLGRAAHPGDLRAEHLGQLHRERPTPPAAPIIKTFWLGCSFPVARRACRAVRPEMGTAAACSKLRLAGLGPACPVGQLRTRRRTPRRCRTPPHPSAPGSRWCRPPPRARRRPGPGRQPWACAARSP